MSDPIHEYDSDSQDSLTDDASAWDEDDDEDEDEDEDEHGSTHGV